MTFPEDSRLLLRVSGAKISYFVVPGNSELPSPVIRPEDKAFGADEESIPEGHYLAFLTFTAEAAGVDTDAFISTTRKFVKTVRRRHKAAHWAKCLGLRPSRDGPAKGLYHMHMAAAFPDETRLEDVLASWMYAASGTGFRALRGKQQAKRVRKGTLPRVLGYMTPKAGNGHSLFSSNLPFGEPEFLFVRKGRETEAARKLERMSGGRASWKRGSVLFADGEKARKAAGEMI